MVPGNGYGRRGRAKDQRRSEAGRGRATGSESPASAEHVSSGAQPSVLWLNGGDGAPGMLLGGGEQSAIMFSLEIGNGTTQAKWFFQVVGAHDPNVTTASFLRLEPDRDVTSRCIVSSPRKVTRRRGHDSNDGEERA